MPAGPARNWPFSAPATTQASAQSNAILGNTKRTVQLFSTLFLYRLLQYSALPFIFIYFAVRLLRTREYRKHFFERLGLLPARFCRNKPDAIWIHAVSAGEVMSALPLLDALRQQAPAVPLYLSTSTVAGRKVADSRAASLVDGVFYAPLDFVSPVRRTLRQLRPSLLVVLETEIWPNLIFQSHLCELAVAFVNARISDRTWPRYRRFARLFRPLTALTDLVLTQSDTDSERFRQMGVLPNRLAKEHNLKYDSAHVTTPVDLPFFGADRIWIAASTVGPNERGSLHRHQVVEEELVIEAFQALKPDYPRLLLILAPRQPARFEEAAQRLAKAGVPFIRRSQLDTTGGKQLGLPGVLLLDTLGELAGLYVHADVVFVGGSLAPRGGHNILEPALAGAPIIVGPHMHNFQSIFEDFRDAGAILEVASAGELTGAVRLLLSNPDRAKDLRRRAQSLARSQTGVAGRVAERLLAVRSLLRFHPPQMLLRRVVLDALAVLWTAGGIRKRRRSELVAKHRVPLGPSVISVGGITVGGSGKTPFANYLATQLSERGAHPAILTRGYRRRWPAKHLVVSPGTRLPPAFTGDEAQTFLRSGRAAVGIGADRYATGRLLLSNYPETDVFVLDDGFQHARIPRDADIVLIDALDPFGGSHVVPVGRLREPLAALRRATIFVVMRAESPRQVDAVRHRLAEWNPSAPVFSAGLEILSWRNLQNNEPMSIERGQRVYAFCGLGNPRSFWQTLELLGLDVVWRTAFGDHHVYTPAELKLLRHDAFRHGAGLLVTTEKDRANFPPNAARALDGIEAAWLEIGVSMPQEQEFFQVLETILAVP